MIKKGLKYILRQCHFLPDELFLSLNYFFSLGKILNLKHPCSFNEKLQWLKLHDRKPEYSMMVDKIEAKKYVAKIVGSDYIIPTLSEYNTVEDVDINHLPDRFVLKCTHDSGGVVVCKDKKHFDIKSTTKLLKKSLCCNFYWRGREWPYKNIKPRILAEEFISDNVQDLIDYKFFCFDGNPKLVMTKQVIDKKNKYMDFYDMNWHRISLGSKSYQRFPHTLPIPSKFREMTDIAARLSSGHIFLRVDLYLVDNKVYFSELTFTPADGLMPFNSPKWENILGSWIKLPTDNEKADC